MINLNTTFTSADIQIYVADLAAYNAGHLHGVFIDATEELDDIQDQINAMLGNSPVDDAEEYARSEAGDLLVAQPPLIARTS